MSSWLNINVLDVVRASCPLFTEVFILSGTAVFVDFYPIIITVAFVFFSFYQREFYLFLLGIAALLDLGVSTALQYIINQPGPFYYSNACGSAQEMPSFATEQISMLLTMVYTFVVFHRVPAPGRKLFFLYFFLYACVCARIYIGINSRLQLLVGSLVGTAEGLVYQFILSYFIFPYSDTIVAWFNKGFLSPMVDSFVNVKQTETTEQLTISPSPLLARTVILSPSLPPPMHPDPPTQQLVYATAVQRRQTNVLYIR